jgi:hypothetical protein
MNDRQPSKRRKLASLQMEADLNKSSLHQRGSVGRPHHDVPHSFAVDPTTIQPPASNETGRVAPTAQPLASNETGQVAPSEQSIPPQEGNAAPVADAPTGPFYDGSYAGMRGAYPEGYEHGADYGGYSATRFNSSMVDDDEAASRAEYVYMQRQASRTPAYGDPYGRPCPSARSASLRTSFDGRERERANPCTPSNESRASCRGWSAIWWPRLLLQRRRPRPIQRRSIRVSFTRFIFILNC